MKTWNERQTERCDPGGSSKQERCWDRHRASSIGEANGVEWWLNPGREAGKNGKRKGGSAEKVCRANEKQRKEWNDLIRKEGNSSCGMGGCG